MWGVWGGNKHRGGVGRDLCPAPTHAASLWHSCGCCAHLSIQVSFSLQVCSWHQALSARRGCMLRVLWGLQLMCAADHSPRPFPIEAVFPVHPCLMVLAGLAVPSIPWGSAFQVLGKETGKGFSQW